MASLEERLTRDFGRLIEVDSERKCVRVDGTQRHLMIASWGGLLDSMAARSRDDGELGVETEIRQLRSLAKHADTGALKPVRRGEEFGAYSEARQRLYKRLIDAATERGIEQEWASRKGLRATPRSYGYGRYIRLAGAIVWFGVNVDQFERTADTPLWVDFQYSFKDAPNRIREALGMQDGHWGAVNLKRDVEYPEMLDGVVDSLKQFADAIQEARFPSA